MYVANGAGGGTWRTITPEEIDNLGADGGVDGLAVMSDGNGGLEFKNIHAYGSMTVTNNSVPIALTAVADTTFNTPSQYTLLTGAGAPFAGEHLHDVSFSTDKLTVEISGIYQVNSWINISAYPSTSASISIRYLINGTTYSSRKPTVKSGGSGAKDQISGFGLLSLNAGDYIQIVVASDASGNLTINDMNTTINLIRAT